MNGMVAFSAAPNGEFDMPPEIKKADLKTRNRWSAKMSRVRKKAHLDKLHAQIDELTNHNLELASVCEDLVKDNGLLRKELEGFGGQAPAVAQAETSGNLHPPVDSTPSQSSLSSVEATCTIFHRHFDLDYTT